MSLNLNKLHKHIVEFHLIQSFPVSCLNRDDHGAPKSAIVGGVNRARVSSQSWKRAVRFEMHEQGVTLGKRTKNINLLLEKAMIAKGAEQEVAENASKIISELLGKDTLVFMSEPEIEALATFAESKSFVVDKVSEKEICKAIPSVTDKNLNGLDIALFGRMVATVNSLNIEGACAFSHAISTHKIENDLDYFTALDDFSDKAGSSHLGVNEFNSATYYRYVSLNLGQLAETLFGEDPIDLEVMNQAIKAFVSALYLAVPIARQNTMSASNPWDYAKVLVRKGQRLQASFEKPVCLDYSKPNTGYSILSIEQLNSELQRKEKMSGSLFGKKAEFELGTSDDFSIDDLINGIQEEVKKING